MTFREIVERPDLSSPVREDAYYLLGRATMALDLGEHDLAERELARLKEL